MAEKREEILRLLRQHWGYDAFRELQEEIILSVLDGHDTLALLPTGGGKSVTFQIPALWLGGLTLVVTPLVSLMKDQTDNLNRRGIGAVYMHSAMTYREMRMAWEKALNSPRCRFLYVSPERLASDSFCEQIRRSHKVRLVAVDEAHCISQWGYDFRPSYLNIARLRGFLPEDTVFMALTASATPEVVDDICARLEFRSPRVFRKSFSRDNLRYVVRRTDDKEGMIQRVLAGVPGTSIVYVRSRKKTVEIADSLSGAGIEAAAFHAGLPYEVKEERQRLWKEGQIRVIVATNAFGMGIDKPDVRSVIHYALPSSLEEYYQEAGRGGRDGKISYAVALVGRDDRKLLRRRISESFPDKDKIRHIYEMMCNYLHVALEEGEGRVIPFDLAAFCRVFSLQERQVTAALGILTAAGWIEYIEDPQSSARVMFIVEREELYGYDGRSLPGSESIIELLLRLYTGLFTDYSPVDEKTLAAEAHMDVEKVHEILLALSRAGIISYIPRRTVPCVYMSRDRVEPQYLTIPLEVYEKRKKALECRIEAVIAYALDDGQCRQAKLLRYFGEKDPGRCGRCDDCIRRKGTAPKRASRGDVARYISSRVSEREGGLDAAQLLGRFPAHRGEMASILNDMEDEGILHRGCGLNMEII